MPVDPPRRFLKSLKRKTETPIVSVDTACVAPRQMVKKPYTRAFKFRSATKKIYARRLTRAWPELDVKTRTFNLSRLPFETTNLKTADPAALVASCEIDHSVGPVVDTIGGRSAGYQRWDDFKNNSLSRYAKRRNDALADGVSRISPYLHYGMVSSFRIAREAAEIDNDGSEKYLDELLIWRELAYVFCFYRDDHDGWSAIPDRAQKTLEQHANDQREETYAREQLAPGETDIHCDFHGSVLPAFQAGRRFVGALHPVGYLCRVSELDHLVAESRRIKETNNSFVFLNSISVN